MNRDPQRGDRFRWDDRHQIYVVVLVDRENELFAYREDDDDILSRLRGDNFEHWHLGAQLHRDPPVVAAHYRAVRADGTLGDSAAPQLIRLTDAVGVIMICSDGTWHHVDYDGNRIP